MDEQRKMPTGTLVTGDIIDERLQISPSVRRALERLGLPVVKLSPRRRRYDLQAVENWLKSREGIHANER